MLLVECVLQRARVAFLAREAQQPLMRGEGLKLHGHVAIARRARLLERERARAAAFEQCEQQHGRGREAQRDAPVDPREPATTASGVTTAPISGPSRCAGIPIACITGPRSSPAG